MTNEIHEARREITRMRIVIGDTAKAITRIQAAAEQALADDGKTITNPVQAAVHVRRIRDAAAKQTKVLRRVRGE